MKLNLSKITPLAAALITGSLSLTSCGGGEAQQQQQQAPAIEVQTIALSNSDLSTTLPATIKGKTDIDIRPQVTGFITKVHVDEGQAVRKGQVLFTLDQVQFQAAVEQAQAAVKSAQTAVANAQMTADNKRRLFEKNIISEYEWQLADNDLKTAQAALAQANATLVTARKNLSYTTVTAPSDGVVGAIPNREGSLASPSSAVPLTTISDNSQVYAYFSLTEKELLELTNNGQRSVQQAIAEMPAVQLRLADGTIFPATGKVATVSGVIDSSTGAASVRALFDNPGGVLRSGSTGGIVMPHSATNVVVIPQKAVYELQDRRFVYVVNDSNTVASRPVTLYPINDGQTYIVTDGLKAGERIVIEGVGTVVREGVTISPVAPGTKEKEAAAAQQGAAR